MASPDSPATEARVLFVDDAHQVSARAERELGARGATVVCAGTARAGLALLAEKDFDVVVADLQLREMDGLELCRRVGERRPGLPVIVVTAFGSMESVVDAMRAGAYDFATKPLDMDDLALRIERARRHFALTEEVARLRRAVSEGGAFQEMVGKSVAMKRVFGLIKRVATTDVSVLFTGETGTGKELAARAIHRLSGRRQGPFVAVNCAALPEDLLESELFGHAPGAFTGARDARAGLFLEAEGGTLLLDEVGEMPPAMQAKLLRALQEKRVRPVGADQEVPYDARILAATNRQLRDEVEAGRFREDLFYRLHVVTIRLPALRERGADVLLIAQHLLEAFAEQHGVPVKRIDPAAAELLMGYDWPGNVRELSNVIERAVALARFDTLRVEDLPSIVRQHQPRAMPAGLVDPNSFPSLAEVERRYVMRVLDFVEGNRTRAATILGIDRKTLYRKLRQWES